MNQPQRLALEKDLAAARSALYRAQAKAEGMALYKTGDTLQAINGLLGEVMTATLRSREPDPALMSFRTYL